MPLLKNTACKMKHIKMENNGGFAGSKQGEKCQPAIRSRMEEQGRESRGARGSCAANPTAPGEQSRFAQHMCNESSKQTVTLAALQHSCFH